MKQFFLKLGHFFRIIDEDHVLSLTYIAMWVCIVKLAIASPASINDIGALFISITAYNFKKWIANQTPVSAAIPDDIASKLASLESTLKATQDKINGVAMSKALSR